MAKPKHKLSTLSSTMDREIQASRSYGIYNVDYSKLIAAASLSYILLQDAIAVLQHQWREGVSNCLLPLSHAGWIEFSHFSDGAAYSHSYRLEL